MIWYGTIAVLFVFLGVIWFWLRSSKVEAHTIAYRPNIQPKGGEQYNVETEDDAMSIILSAAMNSEKPVFGTIDNGVLTIHQEESEEQDCES